MRGIAALAAVTAVSFWLNRGSDENKQDPISGLDTRLDYALQEFEAQYYDAEGRLALNLRAPVLTNNASSGIGIIEQPKFNVVQDGHLWSIVADTATVTADRERILLTGEVNMRRRDPSTAAWLEVNTSEMTLDVTPRVARSEQSVIIVDGSNTLEAVGFRIDMNDDSFHLDNQVKGLYAIN
jgi:LPS export ABC transporter protein LptC